MSKHEANSHPKQTINPSTIYVRIRPNDESGKGGHDIKEEESVEKRLHSYDENSISISDNHKVVKYDFPSFVFSPEAEQEHVYNETILRTTANNNSLNHDKNEANKNKANNTNNNNTNNNSDTNHNGLLDSFVEKNGYNILLFAYGQTGTGKTHTIFGSDESLQNTTFHDDWGIFPRLCKNLFEKIGSENNNPESSSTTKSSSPSPPSVRYILQASAIEFYLMQCYDLLNENGRVPCIIDHSNNFEPIGNTQIEMNSMEDVFNLIQIITSNRATAGTQMNNASSRGHCALILTLYQVDTSTCITNKKQFSKTTFSIVDLAGAERPTKAGLQRMSGSEAMMEIYLNYRNGGEINPAAQGLLINFELTGLLSEILRANDNHIQGKDHKAQRQLASPAMQFFSSRFNGKSILTLMICLSQAPQHGWETWFSLDKFGMGMSKLHSHSKPSSSVSRVKARSMDGLLRKVVKDYEKYQAELDATPEFGSPKSKYYPYRKAKLSKCQNLIDILKHFQSFSS